MRIPKTSVFATALVALSFVIEPTVIQPTHAQSLPKKAAVEQELVQTEFGFFEARKTKDQAYLRNHIPENGVFWSEDGTFSRDQQFEGQRSSVKNCSVEGYSLSDFGMLPLAAGVYLLTYKFDQNATCGGEKLPAHMNGSSVYIFKEGRWQAIYRAEVPLRNQG